MGKSAGKAPLVYKPYQTGHWHSRLAAGRGLKLLGYQAVFVFLYLFIVQALNFNSLILRLSLNLAVVAGLFAFLFLDGTRIGANDTAFAEIVLAKKDRGQEVNRDELDRCFHRFKGLYSAAVGMLPLFLICLVFALTATLQRYRLGSLPEWLSAYEDRAEIELALRYYHTTPGFSMEDALRVVVRLLVFPFVNIIGTDSSLALLWLDRLSPLLALVIPSGYALGYARGARARARTHGEILAGIKKRRRREKAERKRRERANQII